MSRKSRKIASTSDVNENQVETEQTEVGGTIRLAPVLNIEGVGSLKECLSNLFDQYESIEIDGSEVESADTSTLQLLVVLTREAAKTGKKLGIQMSDDFVKCADSLGVTGMLALSDIGSKRSD